MSGWRRAATQPQGIWAPDEPSLYSPEVVLIARPPSGSTAAAHRERKADATVTFLIAAVGAVLAAIVETSVFPELQVAGVSPDLVLVLTIVSGMLLGVEDGLVWAFLGGFMLDMLTPGNRAAGSTALALLVVTGLALLIARVSSPPRIATVVIVVFALTFLYLALLLVLLALTSGVALVSVPIASLALHAVMNAVLAGFAAWTVKVLYVRFGPAERTDW